MKNKLTIKQENFCQEYIRNKGNASDAYRFAYNAKNMLNKSIWEKASELLNSVKVSARVKELKKQMAKRNEVTLDKISKELVEAKNMAMDEGDYKELRANAMDRAKLHGLIVDNTKITATVTKETHDEYIKRVTQSEKD